MSDRGHEARIEGYERIVHKLREDARDPDGLAAAAGAAVVDSAQKPSCVGKGLKLRVFEDDYLVAWPDFTILDFSGRKVTDTVRGILLHYLITANGREKGGTWLSLAQLPGGMFYRNAFQGYTGARLVKTFGNNVQDFCTCACAAGGSPFGLGDASFVFTALPRVDLLAVYWAGDEEFSPSAGILFDSSAPHYLPTDMCAVLGSVLTDLLLDGTEA